jgi:hypothetical protein
MAKPMREYATTVINPMSTNGPFYEETETPSRSGVHPFVMR